MGAPSNFRSHGNVCVGLGMVSGWGLPGNAWFGNGVGNNTHMLV